MSPFFYPIFWAAVIAGTFSPLYAALNRKRSRPNLNASVSLAIIILILILPMFILGTLVFKESSQMYARISAEGTENIQESIGNVIDTVRKNPLMRQFDINEKNLTKRLSDFGINSHQIHLRFLKELDPEYHPLFHHVCDHDLCSVLFYSRWRQIHQVLRRHMSAWGIQNENAL
jgi:predicted PurR-regulated permease PerM